MGVEVFFTGSYFMCTAMTTKPASMQAEATLRVVERTNGIFARFFRHIYPK